MDIVIEIEDVNDNKPTFFRRNIPVNITESYTSGDFVSLDADMAVDQDSGDYILFSIKHSLLLLFYFCITFTIYNQHVSFFFNLMCFGLKNSI